MTNYTNFISPLDLKTIFQNYLAGGSTEHLQSIIFLAIVGIVLAWYSAKNNMPNVAYGMLMLVFLLLFIGQYYSIALLGLFILGLWLAIKWFSTT